MRLIECQVILVVGCSLILLSHPSTSAARSTAVVALEGQTAPDTGGAKFSSFDEPFVNNAGDETFNACYTGGSGDGCGTFLWHAGVLSSIVVSGQTIAGIGTVTLANLNDIDGPIFNNNSTVGLVIRNGNNSNVGAVLQQTLNGPLTIIAKHADSAPNTNKGTFDDFDDMTQNNNDDFAFIATYTEDAGSTFKTGVFLKPSGGALDSIVLNGDTLPNTNGGTQCGTGNADIDGPWMNDSQVVAFIADAICGGTVNGGSAFVKRPGKSLEAFVLKGDPAPASIGGTINDLGVGRPGLNNGNTLGFKAELTAR
jgi:hypothetical protein